MIALLSKVLVLDVLCKSYSTTQHTVVPGDANAVDRDANDNQSKQ